MWKALLLSHDNASSLLDHNDDHNDNANHYSNTNSSLVLTGREFGVQSRPRAPKPFFIFGVDLNDNANKSRNTDVTLAYTGREFGGQSEVLHFDGR